jgi:undecaprenyl-diphosphatase
VERAVVVIILLVVMGFILRGHAIDAPVAAVLNAAHVGVIAGLTSAVYAVFEPVPAILFTMVLTAVVWARTRKLVVAAAFAGVVALTWIPSDVLKVVVERPRPDGTVLPHPFVPVQPDASFPSGHMVFLTAVVLALLMLVRDGRRRRVCAVVGGLVIAALATALAVDGGHWPTDVIASVVWALAVAPLARIVWVDVVLRGVTRRLEQTGRHRSGRGKDLS